MEVLKNIKSLLANEVYIHCKNHHEAFTCKVIIHCIHVCSSEKHCEGWSHLNLNRFIMFMSASVWSILTVLSTFFSFCSKCSMVTTSLLFILTKATFGLTPLSVFSVFAFTYTTLCYIHTFLCPHGNCRSNFDEGSSEVDHLTLESQDPTDPYTRSIEYGSVEDTNHCLLITKTTAFKIFSKPIPF